MFGNATFAAAASMIRDVIDRDDLTTINDQRSSIINHSTILIVSADDIDYNQSSSADVIDDISRYGIDDIYRIYRPRIGLIDKYFTPVWYALGFPGNVLAFAVWIRPRMRPSSGCYLAALAMTDFVFLTLQLLFDLQYAWGIRLLELPVVCELFPVVFLASQYLSQLLVLGFSVERYISICHPFVRDVYCTTGRAFRAIVGLVCLSVAINAVQAYFWSYSYDRRTCFVRDELVWSAWSWLTEMLVFALVPLSILLLNILVIAEYRKVSAKEIALTGSFIRGGSAGAGGGAGGTGGRRRYKAKGSSIAASATTLMLLAVSFYLIASTLPVTICYVLYPTFPPGDQTLTADGVWSDGAWQRHFNYYTVKVVVQELGMSHFAGNFYIYLITGRIFRRELKELCCRRPARTCSGYCGGGGGRGGGGGVGGKGVKRRRRNFSEISRDFTILSSESMTNCGASSPSVCKTGEEPPEEEPFSNCEQLDVITPFARTIA